MPLIIKTLRDIMPLIIPDSFDSIESCFIRRNNIVSHYLMFFLYYDIFLARCYNSRGVRQSYGRFCFDTSLSCWSGLNPAHLSDINNEFYLFTRQYNSDRRCYYQQKLYWDDPNTFDSFHSYKKTIVIIHGWQTSYRNRYFMSLCHSFMKLVCITYVSRYPPQRSHWLVVKFHWGGSATNGPTPFSLTYGYKLHLTAFFNTICKFLAL